MDAFVWEIIGSVAGIAGAAAAIVFGVIPLWQDHRKKRLAKAELANSDQVPELDVRGGKGVQIGTGNQQINNYFTESPVAARPPGGPVIVGEVPQAPPAFQSRDALASALDENGVHALTGMRGVGKTQIAAAYARSRIAAKWRLVAWINAAEPSGLLGGLAETAVQLGIRAPGSSLESAADAVRHWLEADGERCLVVFDNLTDLDHLARYMPAAGLSQIIVTSSNMAAGSLGSAVPVDVFAEDEGLEFLTSRTGLADEHGARELGGELGWLPLALAQAAAVIAAQHLDYATYLARFALIRRRNTSAGYLASRTRAEQPK